MKAVGKRLYVVVDEDTFEETPKTGVQADFSTKKVKATTAVVEFVGDGVTEGKYEKGTKIFIGENYPEKPTQIPGVGLYTIISEDTVMAIL